jgi:hypothetical protein
MRANQRWLFPHPRPLVERFGEDFFRRLPERPAVYLMCGSGEGVLYVGKAKNLRKRLGSYRVANPETLSRRILRLLHRVTRIEWDECPDDSAAGYREEMLIAVLQPRFNRAGKVWPGKGNIEHRTSNIEHRRSFNREIIRCSVFPSSSTVAAPGRTPPPIGHYGVEIRRKNTVGLAGLIGTVTPLDPPPG